MQTLADGTRITNVREERRMQDAEGRTRTELSTDENGSFKLVMITLFDPATHSITHLMPLSKRADVTHLHEPVPPTPEQQARTKELRAQAASEASPTQSGRPQISSEPLALRSIAGVYAEGRRRTRVIPIGREGDDRELRTVTEEWVSPDLHVVLARTDDDPRQGNTTMETTSLDRADPDPALFQMPADYTVVDRTEQIISPR